MEAPQKKIEWTFPAPSKNATQVFAVVDPTPANNHVVVGVIML
jgi:hypothetical protein